MCGIVGFIDRNVYNKNTKQKVYSEKEVLACMMDKIAHRGPDGSGMYLDDSIALGHRRLAIIDIKNGMQPMKNEDETLICIFNGEIYNFQELKVQLEEKGHHFATQSDTEVLLHGYEEWKKELPKKLRGMFAFAIWDNKKKELFCARDYFGIKPFYYYQKEDIFLFGSEIKSFLSHPKFEKQLNETQLELYLTYQYSPSNTTFFENVYKLLPAHYLFWKDGKIEIQRYWSAEFERRTNNPTLQIGEALRNRDGGFFCQLEIQKLQTAKNHAEQTSNEGICVPEQVAKADCESIRYSSGESMNIQHNRPFYSWEQEIEKVMQDSVFAHKISDVEVGSFLSSGVDSAYVTYLADVKETFTIGFENNDSNYVDRYDEAKLAHDFSESIGVKNTIYKISAKEFFEELPKIQYYMDEPLADAASVALYFLNREASKKVKVCLSGEGADELFGGYHIYKEPFMCERYDNLPLFLRKMIGQIASVFPSVKGINFLVRHSKPLTQRYIGPTSLFTEREKKKLLKKFSGKILPIEMVADVNDRYTNHKNIYLNDKNKHIRQNYKIVDEITHMQTVDIHVWLAGDILLKADKMSMANSLELRVPFLDKEVFEVASKLPTEYKVNAKETKIALRSTAEKKIGIENANREKRGFPIPIREWLREEPYVSLIRETFESSIAEQFFNTKKLKKLLKLHVDGKQDCWRKIWCVYVFLVWYEEYFEK